MKNDEFKSNRGGWSRILDISCGYGHHACYYQKDGPGPLKRLYVDRMIELKPKGKTLMCPECSHDLGIKINYVKENRPAYRLFQCSVKKKIVKQTVVK